MSTSGTADVVFCIDASKSMQHCIEEVKKHVGSFSEGLKTGGQYRLDVRMDFNAFSTAAVKDGGATRNVFKNRSVFEGDSWYALYKGRQGKFFTNSTEEFRASLSGVKASGNESTLVSLDYALDYPWRPADTCHRVVILLTDEPCEQGVYIDQQKDKLDALIAKIQALRVALFIVGPDSVMFDQLAAADRCEYTVVSGGDGLAGVDFRKVLETIGKSVSKSAQQQEAKVTVERGIFGQPTWGPTQLWAEGD